MTLIGELDRVASKCLLKLSLSLLKKGIPHISIWYAINIVPEC